MTQNAQNQHLVDYRHCYRDVEFKVSKQASYRVRSFSTFLIKDLPCTVRNKVAFSGVQANFLSNHVPERSPVVGLPQIA